MRRRVSGWLALLSLAGTVVQAEGLSDPDETTIRGVVFESPVPVDRPVLRQLVPLRQGDVLTPEAIEASVGVLKEKGIFSDVEVRRRPVQDGVQVVFVLEPVSVISGIRVDRAEAIEPGLILRRSRLREGMLFEEERLREAERRVEQLYRSRGHPDARVFVDTSREAPDQVSLTIVVDEGEPVRLVELDVTVEDEPGLAAEARSALPFREGEPWTPESLQDGRRALLSFLRAPNRRFYEAEVRATEQEADKRVRARFVIRRGPPFVLDVRGNEILDRKTLLGLVDLEGRPVVTDGTWFELARRIEGRYRQEGYAFAEASVEIVRERPKRVTIEITEGPKLVIRRVAFSGNEALSDGELRRAIETRSAGWMPFLGAPGTFQEGVVRDDLERLRERYRQAGHPDASVRDLGYEFTHGDRLVGLILTFEIREGSARRVEAVQVEGAPETFPAPEAGLRTRAGEVLQPDLVEADRRWLVEELGRLGYPDARVETTLPEAQDEPATVVFQLKPGERVRIGRVLVRGNVFTLDRVVLTRLELAPGDLWSPEAVSNAQSRLYRLGLFRSVSMLPEPPEGPRRDLVVSVRERPGGELQYGFGYDTRVGFRNSLTLLHRNLWGTGRRVSFRGDLNLAPDDLGPDEYLLSLGEREPYVFSLPVDGRADVAFQRSTRSIDEFSVERVAVSGGVEREFLQGFTGTLLLELDDSRIFDVAPDAVLTGQDVGRLRTVSLNPILVYDGRDDPFSPTRGVFDTIRLRYGTRTLGSQVDFFKVVAQHAQYLQLPYDMSGLYALRVGFVEPLGDSRTTPIRERFFLGGRTTVRGFDENEIGPTGDQGNPTGGDLLLNTNVEVRVPVVGDLALAAFVDGGAVYLRDRTLSIREFREAAGPGLRYRTPIGSISFDFGFKLDRRPGESIGEFHFTIGNIF